MDDGTTRGGTTHGGHGRRVRRREPPRRSPVGPMLGWVVLSLVVTAAVLALAGLPLGTLAWLLGAGAVVGAVLLVAVRMSPPADETGSSTPTDGEAS